MIGAHADVVVVGCGPVGLTLSILLPAQQGRLVTILEAALMRHLQTPLAVQPTRQGALL